MWNRRRAQVDGGGEAVTPSPQAKGSLGEPRVAVTERIGKSTIIYHKNKRTGTHPSAVI